MRKTVKYLIVLIIIALSFYLSYLFKIKDYISNEEAINSTALHKETIVINPGNENGNRVLNLYSQSAVLMDAATNRVLYGKNFNKEMPMASTTKIMTCICALENANTDDVVNISKKCASQPKVHLGVKEGEQYRLKDLLYSLMLESHNDSAVAIAEHVSGSVEDFAKLMNQKARDLGCYNTYFITPNGLDANVVLEDGTTNIHHTTAEELAKIMDYCVHISSKKEEFLEITRTKSSTFQSIDGKRSFSVSNHNAALDNISGALSGKTGFTNDAGYCYIGAFEEGNNRFIISLLACGWPNNKNYKWSDCKTLLQYANEEFKYEEIDINKLGIKLPSVKINNMGFLTENRYMSARLEQQDTFMVLKSINDKESVTICMPKTMDTPIEENQEIGMMLYKVNDYVVKTFPIYADSSTIEQLSVGDWIKNMGYLFLEMIL